MSSVSLINGHIDRAEKNPQREKLIELLNGADVFLRNRANGKPAPLNKYDIENLKDIANVCNEAARALEKAIVPPCKVGQTVYQICFGKLSEQKIIKQSKVTGIKITDKLTITLDYTTNFYDTDIGYWFFLTKEEALSKLQSSKKPQ